MRKSKSIFDRHPQRVDLSGSVAAYDSRIGASRPFRLLLANVPSPNRQQPFAGDNVLGRAVSR
jgi:hypothetical protein